MSNSQPAGGRVLHNLVGSLSPGTQSLLSNSHLVPQQPIGDDLLSQQVVAPQTGGLMGDWPEDSAPATQPTNVITNIASDTPQEAPQMQAPQTVVPAPVEDVLDEAKLQIFEEVLNEVENTEPEALQGNMQSVLQGDPTIPEIDPSVLAQAVPIAVTQPQAQPQPQGGGRQKETFDGRGSGTVASTELPGGMQYVEQEKVPELPPEVESYIEHVEADAQDDSQTVVIAEEAPVQPNAPVAPPRIVRVLPISKAQEEVGLRKNSTFSVRWLVEFGHKLAKMFVGQVIYRE